MDIDIPDDEEDYHMQTPVRKGKALDDDST